MPDRTEDIRTYLQVLYGEAPGAAAFEKLTAILAGYAGRLPPPQTAGLTERDTVLITYGDQLSEPGARPLETLGSFCTAHLAGLVTGIHILPFYPASSDDGFSIIDYRAVDPALGTWDNIAALSSGFRLMADAVINHISAQSAWFRGFLAGDDRYRDHFIVVPPGTDLAAVVRPRALPLLTTFATAEGSRSLWTTFSEDQIDLNYRNPDVLLEVIDVLLFYAMHRAEFIRLDAIAYLWKEPGTGCINLAQVHVIIRLLRAVLDTVAPHVMLITETNVPHSDNVLYFGDGYHEAQLVYNFALPPLTLHAFHSGDASTLSTWAAGLCLPSRRVTFFNFLASHDGIGLNPARGILSEDQIASMEERTSANRGLVSYKSLPDATRSAYELNINYWDALQNPGQEESLEVQVDRFIAAQAIMLALPGTPGIYFHSLFGLPGWPEGVTLTGRNRTINRQKFNRAQLETRLDDPNSREHKVFIRYAQLLRARAGHPAFDPYGDMAVLDAGNEAVFAVIRAAPVGGAEIVCLHNVSALPQKVTLPGRMPSPRGKRWCDLITGARLEPDEPPVLAPYRTLWLAEE